jgi:hypothetical protein
MRNTGKVKGAIEWPIAWAEWDALPATVRERVRDLLDEAVDLVTAYAADPAGWRR